MRNDSSGRSHPAACSDSSLGCIESHCSTCVDAARSSTYVLGGHKAGTRRTSHTWGPAASEGAARGCNPPEGQGFDDGLRTTGFPARGWPGLRSAARCPGVAEGTLVGSRRAPGGPSDQPQSLSRPPARRSRLQAHCRGIRAPIWIGDSLRHNFRGGNSGKR